MAFNWSGAAAGGGAGLALGGPVGAGIGAGIGGFAGGGLGMPDPLGDMFGLKNSISTPNKGDFTYKGMAEPGFQQLGQQMYNRAPVQADLGQYNQSRGLAMQSREGIDQMQKRLGTLAQDDNASVAYRQMQAGGDQNMRQALALARSAGGGGGAQGSALRQAQMGNTVAGQQLNQQTGIMRAGETAQANAQMAQLAAQQRAYDLQAQGLDAQTAMSQAQLELGSQQLGTQGMLGMYGLGQQASALQQKGLSDYWKTLLGGEAAAMQAEAQQKAGIMGGIGAIGGGLIAGGVFSDVNAKINVTPVAGPAFGTPGQPQITTGGAMTSPTLDLGPRPPSFGQKFMQGYGTAQDIFGAFQPHGQVTGLQPIEGYLPGLGMTDSDARAKRLEGENDALRSVMMSMAKSALPVASAVRAPVAAVSPAPVGTMQTGMAAPGAEGAMFAMPAARVSPAEVARQANRDRMTAELSKRQKYNQEVFSNLEPGGSPADYQQARAQWDLMSPYANPDIVTSDEHSKQRIQELEGIVASLSGNPGGRYVNLDEPAPQDEIARQQQMFGSKYLGNIDELRPENRPAPARVSQIEPATIPVSSLDAFGLGRVERGRAVQAPARYGQDAGSRRVANVQFPFRSDLEAQAAAIPSYRWNYDPQHAAQANAKAGLPPDAPFGFDTKSGPMAQQLQRLPALSGAVTPGPDGLLQVDSGQATMSGLGMLGEVARHAADLEERLRGLEATRGKVPYPKPRAVGGG